MCIYKPFNPFAHDRSSRSSPAVRATEQNRMRKRITDVFAQYTPHKFAWFYGKPEECAERLVGKTIDKACPQGGMVELTAGDTMLVLTDGVNLRYFEPGAKLPSKHQLLVAFDDESCLLASVRMYGALLCFTEGILTHHW